MNAALYIRLSKEDMSNGPSESVTNQKSLLLNYTQQHNITVHDIYIDDGWSGGNFDRPAFQRLLGDIEAGQVDTVITKDLSRLGRDYILTGHYLERYFPEHRVRYISLLDGIDTGTDTYANEITPFRAIMNDMYAKDISKKITSVKREKQRQGQFIGPKAIYGYQKDPLDKNHLIIDESAAKIVRRIFCMAFSGESCRSIAQQLNSEYVPPPSAYCGARSEKGYCFTGKWSSERISELLQNETYIGNMVQGRTVKSSYKSKKCLRRNREDWIIVENTHEALIDPETFHAVQQLLASRRRTRCRKYDYPLKGMVYCHECGHPLGVINRKNSSGEDVLYFICRTHQRFTQNSTCSPHCIKVDIIAASISDTVHAHCSALLTNEELLSAAEDILRDHTSALSSACDPAQEIERISNHLNTLYLDFLDHRIEREDFDRLYSYLTKKREELRREQNFLSQNNSNSSTCADKFIKDFLDSMGSDKLILSFLIKRIEITKERDVIIEFRFNQ